MNRPNILLITSDQQHWNTIGVFNKEIITPSLDRLVREGTAFSRAYCPNPTCTPTRASIITGKYPSQHGAWSLGTKLSEEEHTIGEYLTNENYRTALVGKAHFQPLLSTEEFPSLESQPLMQNLDFWKDFNGPFYGFEHCELARNHTNEYLVGQHYALWMEEKGCKNWRDYFLPPTGNMDEKIKRKWKIPEEFHYDAWITERSNNLLEQYKKTGENFFLWSSFFDPHPEYYAPEPWDSIYDPDKITLKEVVKDEHKNNPLHFQMTQEKNPDFSIYDETYQGIHGFHSHLIDSKELRRNIAVYYGMISLMDKYIGRILDKLDELGLAENTIVVFSTDHGHFIGQHGLIAKGAFHYEDLIKIPLIVRYPGKVPPNRISNAMQSLVDLAPTFLKMAGIPIPRSMTGIDQSMVWTGIKEKERDHIICENHHEPTTVHLKTYVDERYKITVYYNHEYGELFDLEKDPYENNNLWNDNDYVNLKSDLLLRYIWAELGKEPLWMPRVSIA